MRVGFIGLGNVGGKLASNLARNGTELVVRDVDPNAERRLADLGAATATSGRGLAEQCDVVITCLPSPEISAAVLEEPDGVLDGLGPGKVWAEMSTTDASEVRRLASLVEATGASAM